ncbi:putative transposase [Shigella flexneri 1485-80]|nr:putative transposase [Shigella flexneri 1485-80]
MSRQCTHYGRWPQHGFTSLKKLRPQSVTSRIQPGSDVIVCAEMDEQWGYVGAKSRQRWLFYAYDRIRRTVVAHVFTVMGVIGFVLTALWIKLIHNPTDHPRMSAEELKFISENGAVVDMDHKKPGSAAASGPKLHYIKQLLSNRMMLGVFFGQYFINTITWFFLTWFPIYLVQEKGMSILKVGLVASIPALCGFAGGVLGGVFSDYLIKRGLSLTLARKLPIVLGMLLASTIILCNYTNNTTLVVMLMALAFFGKGFGALGWPVISDTAPKEIVGLCGGVFNVFGNVASIVTPLVIGYLVSELHSFNAALVFVGCSALMAMVCYLFVVGDIKRMELQK